MQPTAPPPRGVLLRRYGPLVVIVVALAIVAAIVLATRGNGHKPSSTSTLPKTTPIAHNNGALSWSQAAAEGKTSSINWGSRCDTTTGKLKIPYYFAGQCYAPFSGNNGGSTYQGVTANAIKVVLYLPEAHDPVLSYIEGPIADTDTNKQTIETIQGWVKFLSTYYETYGRKIDLIPYVATGASTDDVAARADATTIASTIKPFAVIGGPILTSAFGQLIVANHIFCIDCLPDQPNAYYAENSPYVIGLGINGDESNIQLADYIGAQLAGRPAAFAGNPAMHTQTRKFGLVYLTSGQATEVQVNHLVALLAKSGVKIAARLAYTSPVTIDSVSLIAKLKAAGVTSVIFSGDPIAPGSLTRAATSQNYFPEWIITGSALTDTTIFARTYDQRQWAHAFGISFLAARTDPKISGAIYLYHWFFGKNPPAHTGAAVTVPDIQLLFVAMQGTGPDVTPANVLAALFAAPKPPEALTEPMITFGSHGIWPQTDYLGIDDATEIWWNPNAHGPDELNKQGKGMYEYVQGGKRYLPGAWPKVAPDVFNVQGAVTIYETVPPSESVPNYPSPAHAG